MRCEPARRVAHGSRPLRLGACGRPGPRPRPDSRWGGRGAGKEGLRAAARRGIRLTRCPRVPGRCCRTHVDRPTVQCDPKRRGTQRRRRDGGQQGPRHPSRTGRPRRRPRHRRRRVRPRPGAGPRGARGIGVRAHPAVGGPPEAGEWSETCPRRVVAEPKEALAAHGGRHMAPVEVGARTGLAGALLVQGARDPQGGDDRGDRHILDPKGGREVPGFALDLHRLDVASGPIVARHLDPRPLDQISCLCGHVRPARCHRLTPSRSAGVRRRGGSRGIGAFRVSSDHRWAQGTSRRRFTT